MSRAELRQARLDKIKQMYIEWAFICDIADEVGYEVNTVLCALSEMGFSVENNKPRKAEVRTPKVFPVVVDGKE